MISCEIDLENNFCILFVYMYEAMLGEAMIHF